MEILLRVVIIAMGLAQFLVAAHGKVRLPIGLTEILLNRLPERPWRITVCVLGVLMIALGTMVIIDR